ITFCVPKCGPVFAEGQQSETGGVLPPGIQVLQKLHPKYVRKAVVEHSKMFEMVKCINTSPLAIECGWTKT
ncbi:hypothetical protein, partial [uncultured Fibrobacter sp.]|uniref:hypothetical protein n=1 Tax=uncultured Fibrobacter sp. TaxID=261512 RepID=UPI0025F82E53